MSVIGWPEDRWEPCEPRVELSGGPERIYDDEPKPNTTRRVGFGIEPEPVEPLLWDGDNA
ncbi:hypothetical protein [Aeromicrobium sp. HA]|uniref:hypothetical protein n=1 Tax=Aeromicrobium sp. HA TaxID=3009077 RepID=UPI0022AE6F55|nr:hypothetical protein [Aeromicrobium sp. HA]